MVKSIQSSTYTLLYLLLAVVYISGILLPIMENDSAQHATMAMDMYLKNDFLHIYKGFQPYLDKPHMHFWLSALSFKAFGISVWAYRLPALLFTIMGAISCFGLAKQFYTQKAAHYASIIFLTMQAIILANHDVRTDAVLTGASIFCLWQLMLFLKHLKFINAVLAALGLAIAFSSKGQLAIFFIGICLIIHLIFSKQFHRIWNWKFATACFLFFVFISPVLYAYYIQFNVEQGINGVKFILWDQSFNRMNANGYSKNNPDYFFFFHTLLWAAIPWGVIVYAAFFKRIKQTLKPSTKNKNIEFFTSIGVLAVLLVISSSKTKLPHYLNSLLPILAVLIAGYIFELKPKNAKTLYLIQIVLIGLLALIVFTLFYFCFELPNIYLIISYLTVFTLLIKSIRFKKETYQNKIIISGVYISVFINLFMNTHFYPNLFKYQAGIGAADYINQQQIPSKEIYKLDNIHTWSLDFYTENKTQTLTSENSLEDYQNKWLYINQNQYNHLLKRGIKARIIKTFDSYRITRLKLKFLNKKTRHKTLSKMYLIKI